MTLVAVGWLAFGCTTPTRALLTSRCADAGDGARDPACLEPDSPCSDDTQCPPSAFCSAAGSCEPCQMGPKACPDCPKGIATKRVANGCVVCDCQAACKTDGDCGMDSVCAAGMCTACATLPASCPLTCPWNFQARPLQRNGCTTCECVPPNQCLIDADCPGGQQCYAGAQCPAGCTTPACCFGNICAAPGCKGYPNTTCAVTGCSAGTCAGSCAAPPVCACSAAQWTCAKTDCADTVCK